MSKLIIRVQGLIDEINDFGLGNCSPSDDPDKQTAYVYGYKDLVKRFIASASRLNNPELIARLEKIDPEVEHITDAYNLRAEITAVFDLIEDITESESLQPKIKITAQTGATLRNLITACLSSESANNLPKICANYGLQTGDTPEAFKSKANYVTSRISHLDAEESYSLAKRLEGKYPDTELDQILKQIADVDELNVISRFEDIRAALLDLIRTARFSIWVAVAWFTDLELARELYKRSKEGLNVRIIIHDDQINEAIYQKIKDYFEIHKISPTELGAIMHHKFCVVDLNKVAQGSFNWTNRARYNKETLSILENRAQARHFAEEFVKLTAAILTSSS